MNPYEELELPEDCTKEEIKKSYKKKASKSHPDKGGDVEKFKNLQNAYMILIDSEKRERYDKHGTSEPTRNPVEVLVGTLFADILGKHNLKGNLVTHCKNKLAKTILDIENSKVKINLEIKKFQKQLGRLESSEEENFFESAVKHKVQGLKDNIVKHDEALKINREAFSVLDNYKDTRPEEEQNFIQVGRAVFDRTGTSTSTTSGG